MRTQDFSAFGARFALYVMDAGEKLPRHNHPDDHLTVVCAGSARVTTDEKTIERTSLDRPLMLRAPNFHEIEALQDRTVLLNIFKKS